MTSALESEIERLVAPALEGMGYAVVRVKMTGAPRRTLQIMAEQLDGAAITVDHCTAISRAVSALLDVEEAVSGSYNLEVSSPGIDRPLVRRADFERFTGHEARIETHDPLDGRKRFRGKLLGVCGDAVRIAVDGGVAEIPLAAIAGAKLMLSDALIAATQAREHA